jgi:hypothetical protein
MTEAAIGVAFVASATVAVADDEGRENDQPTEEPVAASHADSSRSGPNTAFGM